MAIIVEQEKKPLNWINIAVIIVFVILIFGLAYYVFFKRPELVETILPQKLTSLSSLKELKIDPNPLLADLKKYFTTTYNTETTIPSVGRVNPFEPF